MSVATPPAKADRGFFSLPDFLTGTPPADALAAAQAKMDAESDPVKKAELKVDVCKAELEVAKANAASAPKTGGRRRKGGKHTKKHKKGGKKGKSTRLTRARSGRKSSRL